MTQVSELLNTKIVNANLTFELFQMRANAELQRLMQVRNDLVEQARKEVNAPAEHVYNTDTRTFQPKSGPMPLSTPRKRQVKRLPGAA